jgi:hypothetical protein
MPTRFSGGGFHVFRLLQTIAEASRKKTARWLKAETACMYVQPTKLHILAASAVLVLGFCNIHMRPAVWTGVQTAYLLPVVAKIGY